MTERRVDGFFYGLFMDKNVLQNSGVSALGPRRAYVDGYALRIGRRATLVSEPTARTYGMLYSLTHSDLERLYGAPGLEQYRPEAVIAQILGGDVTPALCYNLLEPPGAGEVSSEYAEQLREALGRLGFPPDYVASVS